MKAFVINKYGKTEKLQLTDVANPVISENELLVEVHAAGLNLLDSKIKAGEFKLFLPYKLPLVLGHDVAGVVVEAGRAVKKFKVGDQIYARPADFRIGTFAQYIAVNEADAALKPNNISMTEAASLPLVSLTVWQAFMEKARLKKGQKVFIQAGSGGVGTIAIQLAKHLGLHVATTTSKNNEELVSSLGADVIIDYRTTDFEQVLSDYDFVLNSQDTNALKKSINILSEGGQVVSISGPPTAEFARQAGLPWFFKIILSLISLGVRRKARRKDIRYSFLFMQASGSQLAHITKLVESGVIKPVVDKVFPFEQTGNALEYVESGRAKGKVVITMR
ncbi:MAG: NADPH:quinone oxidoreductase [Dyadobacter sp. 50-39]|uniref:NADP-dependent oxidoreductase n=1 Tax=Dyadobacter sp. 50-39 TaxID=1895756 RepID=UPI0009646FF1|nr:NADP-dependent oxidoreductase [Dyadobacter sp. 50-39]OJV12596.1 MAG: NADPH:quinone oxidoreductase [Dyadobacter sp. 50-39]